MFNPFGQYKQPPKHPGLSLGEHMKILQSHPQHLNPRQFAKTNEHNTLQKSVDEATGILQRNRAFRTGGIGLALRYTVGLNPMSSRAGRLYQSEAIQHMAQPDD
jgi:hypothetical protein